MSERDRGMAIAMLAEAFAVRDLTPARIKIYNTALDKVPVSVLEPMVQRAITTRQWFPKVAELLADAEAVRLERLKALGEPGCAQCEDSRGWIAVTHADGVKQERCGCWRRLQAQRAALEVGAEPLALTAAVSDPVSSGGES